MQARYHITPAAEVRYKNVAFAFNCFPVISLEAQKHVSDWLIDGVAELTGALKLSSETKHLKLRNSS